jgi:hypothetical protein
LKVLYIVGWGRSGSTILDNLLGQLDGFLSTGELRNLWQEGLTEGRKCGCGAPVRTCPVWSRVLAESLGRMEGWDTEAAQAIVWEKRALRTRHTACVALATKGWGRPSEELRAYSDLMGRVYSTIGTTTDARVIVDSSKVPSHAFLLESLPEVEAYFVHLVRDPRAAAFSWKKTTSRMDRDDTEPMPRFGTFKSASNWLGFNLAAEALRSRFARDRMLLVRYEDFVLYPQKTLLDIIRLVGENVRDLPFEGDRVVRLGLTHTVSGNPSRFRTGSVELKEDVEWVSGQSSRDRLLATVIASPLLHRYGYVWNP